LPELEKLGLAVKIISSPAIYRATPLENGFSMLLERKTEENLELQKKAKLLFNNFTVNVDVEPQEKTPQFVITSEKKLYFKKVEKEVKQAQTSINIICSKEGVRIIASLAVEEFEKAIARDVKIRVLTNDVEGRVTQKSIQRLQSNPDFELKIFSSSIPVGLVTFDGKEVDIGISATILPTLWTNNANVVKLSEVYFESMWSNVQTN
jgi:sugar-specific transcriptional regulator TrmB